MNKQMPQAHGLLLIDKPAGLSSTNCLEKIKKGLGQKKIGHAGTLDPMAKGLLIALLGKATKLASYITSREKTYQGQLQLGLTTDTYDKEGTILESHSLENITPDMVYSEINSWICLNEQDIPPYSAAKYQGKTFYSLQRRGQKVPQRKKSINIKEVDILKIEFPFVSFKVRCSHGTYIRSLAHSLGTRLGCGAILMDLIREQSDPFCLKNAFELEKLLQEPEHFFERLISVEKSLPEWSKIRLNQEQVKKVRNGIRLRIKETGLDFTENQKTRALFLSPDDQAVALVEMEQDQNNEMFWKILRGL